MRLTKTILRPLMLFLVSSIALLVMASEASAGCASAPFHFDTFYSVEPNSPFKEKLKEQKTKLDAIAQTMSLDLSQIYWATCNDIDTPSYTVSFDRITIFEFDGNPAHENEAVILHEYSHAIHYRYMKLHSSDFVNRALFALGPSTMELRQNKLDALLIQKTGKSGQELADLNAKIATLYNDIADGRRNYARRMYVAAYMEFFADTMAVLALNDKEAISTALKFKTRTQHELDMRSFNYKFSAEDLKNWQAEMQTKIAKDGYVNPYFILGPLRSLVGNNIITRQFSDQEIAVIAQKLLAVITEDMEIQVPSDNVDPLQFNMNLYKKISAALN